MIMFLFLIMLVLIVGVLILPVGTTNDYDKSPYGIRKTKFKKTLSNRQNKLLSESTDASVTEMILMMEERIHKLEQAQITDRIL